MRRDLDAVMAQIAELNGLVHNTHVLAQQVQQQDAAGMQLRPAAEGSAAEGGREIFEKPVQSVQAEQLAAGEQRDEQGDQQGDQDDQQGARGAHTGDRPEVYPQNGDSCLGTAVSAKELECPISALQTLLWYEQHDPPLHRETDKHWTVNGPTMYDYISGSRPEVTAAYEAAAAEPGPHLEAAMGEFVSSVAAGTPGGSKGAANV